jgi:hypothetical protein
MISDTLFEARIEIERYMREMPESYENMRPELTALCAEMYRIQMTLDRPPHVNIPVPLYTAPEA